MCNDRRSGQLRRVRFLETPWFVVPLSRTGFFRLAAIAVILGQVTCCDDYMTTGVDRGNISTAQLPLSIDAETKITVGDPTV